MGSSSSSRLEPTKSLVTSLRNVMMCQMYIATLSFSIIINLPEKRMHQRHSLYKDL